jgi:hypothetical protein
VEVVMGRLTRTERLTLEVMLKFRDDPPTTAGLIMANWKRYLFLIGYFTLVGTGIGVAVSLGQSHLVALGCVFGGLLAGILLRDLGAMNAAAGLWGVTREVTDWEKVHRLIEEDDEERGQPASVEEAEGDRLEDGEQRQ